MLAPHIAAIIAEMRAARNALIIVIAMQWLQGFLFFFTLIGS